MTGSHWHKLSHRLWRRVDDVVRSGPLILMYHRIASPALDPQCLCVTEEHFKEHLEIIRKCAKPIALSDMIQKLKSGDCSRQAVAITFDDGYADNLHIAVPLLNEAGLPATVFISTGFLDTRREMYWDELAQLLLEPNKLPDELALPLPDHNSLSVNLREFAGHYDQAEYKRNQTWRVTNPTDPTPRHQFYRSACEALRRQSPDARCNGLEALYRSANLKPVVRPDHRGLKVSEVQQLTNSEGIQIGAHTGNHISLANHSPDIQLQELIQCRDKLADLTGQRPVGLAYPYGGLNDFNATTMKVAEQADYQWACTTIQANARSIDLPYALPRRYVGNWNGEQFERWLRKHLQ